MSRRGSDSELYVRPPLVAFEPPSPRASRRRFRIILLVVFLAVAAGTFFLARALLASGEGNPSLGIAPPAPLTAAFQPTAGQ